MKPALLSILTIIRKTEDSQRERRVDAETDRGKIHHDYTSTESFMADKVQTNSSKAHPD